MKSGTPLILFSAQIGIVIALVLAGRWSHPLPLWKIVVLVVMTVGSQMLAYYCGRFDAR